MLYDELDRYARASSRVWPASIRRFLSQRHRWLPSPPTLAPDCETAGRRVALAILSPPAGQILVLLPGVAASDQEIPLQAESTSPGATLSWFVNGEFLGTAAAAERLWWLATGRTVSVVGYTDSDEPLRLETQPAEY